MFTNHYTIEDMSVLHAHVIEYQSKLLNEIEYLTNIYPSDECQKLLQRLKEEVQTLPYKTLTVFYAEHEDTSV